MEIFWKVAVGQEHWIAGRCCHIWESRLVSKSSKHYPNKTCPLGYRLCLAPSIGRGRPRTCEINRAQHRTQESGRLVHSSAGKPTDVQIMVPCPAAAAHHAHVCPINPVWQLPAVHPVIDEACTLVFHV